MVTEVQEYAKEAADLIRKNGWIQGENDRGTMMEDGSVRSDGGGTCIDLALGPCDSVKEAVYREIGITYDGGCRYRLWEWNDAPERTIHEVLAVLDAVAGGGSEG